METLTAAFPSQINFKWQISLQTSESYRNTVNLSLELTPLSCIPPPSSQVVCPDSYNIFSEDVNLMRGFKYILS